MSLFGSLFTGVSGLNAQSRAMGMISDNIANVSTTAYKGASAQFSNLVTRKIGVANHNPGGVRAQTSYNITGQGLIQSSASPTDLAIAGAGFFVVNSLVTGGGEQVYTRAGAFQPDAEGNLRTPAGHYLQGWMLDANGEVAQGNQLQTVNISEINGRAAATEAVELAGNLNADAEVYAGPPAYVAGDLAAYEASGGTAGVEPSFTRPVQIFDSLGRAHDVTVAFLRTGAANTWSVELIADPAAVDAGTYVDGRLAAGTVTFDGQGRLQGVALTPTAPAGALVGDPVQIVWSEGADPSTVTFDFGTIGEADGFSQFRSESIASARQNGIGMGGLVGVSVDESGFVSAAFANGETRRIYQLPIATFANPGALDPRSGNVYAQTTASGEINLRTPGTGGAGTLTPSALEAANVDLGEEFTKMIVTQRAYSANAKVINTTDQMLDELIRIGR